jgi:ATP-dependent helicase/nuclease subunit A
VYAIEHMAAVTFTRKAAAELRGRFQLALEARLDACAPDTDEAQRIQSALANLERFFAGTIHAFCARLLRERPVEAGVSPGFTELDDVEEQLLREQSWRDYRAQAKASGDLDLVALTEAGVRTKDFDKAFKTICLFEDVEFPPGDAPVPNDRSAWRGLDAFWTELSRLLPDPIDEDTSCPTQKAARRFARDWRFARRGGRTPAALADLLKTWAFAPKITQNRWSDDPARKKRLGTQIPEMHQAFRDRVVDPYLTAWRQHVYRLCVTVLTRARDEAERERRRRNTLSFNDLLRLTANVLRENAAVRAALRRKYRWIFVDEFQDTDPLQAEIMLLLSGHGERGRKSARTPQDGEPGVLFVVGDPKQSIYRFRRADIDIYTAVRRVIGGSDGRGVVTLTTNFRSTPSLCDWANDVFRTRFPAAATQQAPQFAPLRPKPGARDRGPSLFTLTLAHALSGADQRQDEAARIARYIRAEVDAGRRRFGDFMILTRKKRGLQALADALESLEVPLEVSGAGAFGESNEVQQLAALLTALADPQDAVALVGVLRGPLFGLSDRELFAHRQAGGRLNLFDDSTAQASRATRPAVATPPTPPPDKRRAALPLFDAVDDATAEADGPDVVPDGPVASALRTMRRWFKWSRMLPAGAALDRILEDSGYLALAAATPDGVEAGDLLHAIDRVRASVEAGFTLAQSADALAASSGLDEEPQDSSEIESLPLRPGRTDVVRLMNLHKAKGLEAAVVFLADPTGGFKPRVDVRIVRDDGPGADRKPLGYFSITPDRGWGAKPIAEPEEWDRFEQEELAYLSAENDRLLYVAATRAKDMLVVSRGGSKGTPAWAELEPFLKGVPELAVPAAAPPASLHTVDLSTAAIAAADRVIAAAHARARQPSWSASSVTADTRHGPRITHEMADDDDPTRVIDADTPSRRADAGLAWGTLVHGLLEHAMRHPGASRSDLRRLALWLTVDEPSLRGVIEEALDTVASVAGAGFWQDARAAAECHEEAPFSIRTEREGLPHVLSGTIDVVYRTAGEWRIVDYKTDVAGAADNAGYRAQLDAYAAAWPRFGGGPATARIVEARPTNTAKGGKAD